MDPFSHSSPAPLIFFSSAASGPRPLSLPRARARHRTTVSPPPPAADLRADAGDRHLRLAVRLAAFFSALGHAVTRERPPSRDSASAVDFAPTIAVRRCRRARQPPCSALAHLRRRVRVCSSPRATSSPAAVDFAAAAESAAAVAGFRCHCHRRPLLHPRRPPWLPIPAAVPSSSLPAELRLVVTAAAELR